MTEKKKENLIQLVSMAAKDEREVWDVIEEDDEYCNQLLDNIDMATLMEDVDS